MNKLINIPRFCTGLVCTYDDLISLGNPRNGSHATSGPNSRTGSQATLTSIDSLGELPSVSRRPQSRQKNRESYMEAMSMGSFDETGSDRYSVTTDPVDL